MTIFDSIATEIDNLKRSPHVEVLFHKNKLTPDDRLIHLRTDLESIIGLKLPPSIADSVKIDDDMHVYWKSKVRPEGSGVFGEFFLQSVTLFADNNQLNEVFLSRRYKAIDDMRAMRVFDYYAYNGGPIYSLLRLVDGRLDEQVYVFNERDVFTTTLDYAEYLKRVRLTRGFQFWQYLFCESPDIEDYDLAGIKRGMAFIESEFPKEEYSELRSKLEALEKGRR